MGRWPGGGEAGEKKGENEAVGDENSAGGNAVVRYGATAHRDERPQRL